MIFPIALLLKKNILKWLWHGLVLRTFCLKRKLEFFSVLRLCLSVDRYIYKILYSNCFTSVCDQWWLLFFCYNGFIQKFHLFLASWSSWSLSTVASPVFFPSFLFLNGSYESEKQTGKYTLLNWLHQRPDVKPHTLLWPSLKSFNWISASVFNIFYSLFIDIFDFLYHVRRCYQGIWISDKKEIREGGKKTKTKHLPLDFVFFHPSEWTSLKQRRGKMAHSGLDVLKSAIILLAD